MTRRRFFLIAAIVGLFAHDGAHAQVHMSARTVLTDAHLPLSTMESPK